MLKEFLKSLRINEQKISMFLGAAVVLIVGVLIYNYFSGINRQAEVAQSTITEKSATRSHLVLKGESLWQISLKYYQNGYKWPEIAQANNLTNPNLIEEGQSLAIPEIESPAKVEPETILTSEYLVVKGDNLWNISVRAYADGYQWVKIWDANKETVANPNMVKVGTKLSLPR